MINNDIISYIYSFLPIVDDKIKVLNIQIKFLKSDIYNNLIEKYRSVFEAISDNYLSWLINDIARWMNQDITPTMNGFTKKYFNILKKTTNINFDYDIPSQYLYLNYLPMTTSLNTNLRNNLHNYWNNLYQNPISQIKIYINKLSLIEVINLNKFIHSLN